MVVYSILLVDLSPTFYCLPKPLLVYGSMLLLSTLKLSSYSVIAVMLGYDWGLFGVLGPRCWTGPSMLNCHVLKGFGIYMIGILGSLY